MITRRRFIQTWTAGGAISASALIQATHGASAATITALTPGPEVDQFKAAQDRLLKRFGVPARSHFLKLKKPLLQTQVLEAGSGSPVLLLHGGGGTAASWAPLMARLQDRFHCFAPDRPGCGLSDKIDYRDIPLRQHAIDFLSGVLDGLKLPRAALIANSMGGYWSLVFALAHPERVSRLVLIGEPAASGPPQADTPLPPPAAKKPTLEGIRALYRTRLAADVERIAPEILEEDLAARTLPGAGLAWDSMVDEFVLRQHLSTYALRPELKGLHPPTLIIWGERDKLGGGPAIGREMAALAPRARCEVLADAGHVAWIDQPERCATLVAEFLATT